MITAVKRTNKVVYIMHLIVCMILFLAISALILVYHGPFTKLRNYIVSTAMATNSNHMFATLFLSQQEISQILSKTQAAVKDSMENINDIETPSPAPTAAPVQSNINGEQGVTIQDVSGENFKGKLMIVSDPSRIVLGLAPELGKIGAPLSRIVSANNAVGGINAGGFQDDNLVGTGSLPDGVVVQDGEIKYCQNNADTYSVIGFTKNNVLLVSNGMTLDQIKNSDLRCAVSFGPALIMNGQPLVEQGGSTLQPRSAIGQKKDGTILLLAIDGREIDSKGVNFKTLQDVLLQYGAYNAANLDGGSSTTMNYLGETINNPCDITGERNIATAYLIANTSKDN